MSHPEKITPCPFCGNMDIAMEVFRGDRYADEVCDATAVLSCRLCFAVGPVTAAQSQAQAWARWNQRMLTEADEVDACCGGCSRLPHGLPDFELDDFV